MAKGSSSSDAGSDSGSGNTNGGYTVTSSGTNSRVSMGYCLAFVMYVLTICRDTTIAHGSMAPARPTPIRTITPTPMALINTLTQTYVFPWSAPGSNIDYYDRARLTITAATAET